MRTISATMIRLLVPLVPLFSERAWQHVRVLLAGAILAPGKRTVSSALHAMGLYQERWCFHRYHRVPSHASSWSSLEASSVVLLGLLVEAFVPDAALVLGVDETLERRRWGPKIRARGIYCDPIRSLAVWPLREDTSGLRWVRLTLLAPIPWALPAGLDPTPLLSTIERDKSAQEAHPE